MNGYEQSIKYAFYGIVFVIQIILSSVSYIPQIIKLLKVKDSKGISLASWMVSLFDYASYQLLLMLDNASLPLQILNIVQMLQILMVISLIHKYENKEVAV